MAQIRKNCKKCNIEFIAKQNNHYFCSKRCRLLNSGAKFIKEKKDIVKNCFHYTNLQPI